MASGPESRKGVTVDREELVAFVRRRGQAVLATRGPDGAPQATAVDVAVTDQAEIVFDVSIHSREYQNLQSFPLVAMVVGGGEEVTLQCEGAADLLAGQDRDRCLRAYFQQHPDGRERALAAYLAYVRIRPRSLRLSDFRSTSFGVQEFVLEQ
jgi:Pyridoxamine 5'-phosphate oxidase